jgi:cytochrome P450 family 4
MARHPDVQDRAVQELEEVFGDDTRTPSLSDLRRLKYLEQCLKETLRLYPSVPILSRTLVEDAKIGISAYGISSGQEISTIVWNPWICHLSSQILTN